MAETTKERLNKQFAQLESERQSFEPQGKENAASCGVVFNFRCVAIWVGRFTGSSSVSRLNPNVVNE